MPGISRIGSEFPVIQQIVGDQTQPAITSLQGGGFVVVWQATPTPLLDSASVTIRAQVYDADGNPVGDDFAVKPQGDGQGLPSVASLSDGGFIIAWQDAHATYSGDPLEPDQDSTRIEAQRYSATGEKIGTEIVVNTKGAGAQVLPVVTGLAGGGFVVSWQDGARYSPGSGTLGDTDESSIKAQVFAADGSRLDGEFLVNAKTQGAQTAPTITALTGGGFVVAWQDTAYFGSGGGAVRAQICGADGTKLGSEIVLTPAGSWDGASSPVVKALPNGGFVAAWARSHYDAVHDASELMVVAQIFAADGSKIGDPVVAGDLPNRLTNSADELLALSTLDDNGFVLAWQTENAMTPAANGILAQRFAADGTKLGGTYPIGTRITEAPALAALENGHFIVSWSDGSALKAQILAAVDNVGPSITSAGGAPSIIVRVGEHADVVTTVTASDPDDPASALTYAIVGGPDAEQLRINPQTGVVSFNAAPDFENPADTNGDNVYRIVVAVSDGALSDRLAISVRVTNVNEAPRIISGEGADKATYMVAENTTAVTSVLASDPDAGARLNYAITGGVDAALFVINSRTGALAFRQPPDFESRDHNIRYEVVVSASDGQFADTQAVTVFLTNVLNERIVGTAHDDVLRGNSGNDYLSGGSGDDSLYGSAGNDVLIGGRGKDRLEGNNGDDFYYVDNINDAVIEKYNNGFDTIRSSVSYALSVHVERLVLTGTGNLSGRGNDLGNRLDGNAGSNTLMGFAGADKLVGGNGDDRLSGGTGKDVLTGGAGKDSFVFDAPAGAANVDRITDFDFGEGDKIQLVRSLFAGIGHLGPLTSNEFYAAAGARNAHDPSDRIIYDSATGKLFYDGDGLGGSAAQLIAVLGSANHPTLIYSDFEIIA